MDDDALGPLVVEVLGTSEDSLLHAPSPADRWPDMAAVSSLPVAWQVSGILALLGAAFLLLRLSAWLAGRLGSSRRAQRDGGAAVSTLSLDACCAD